MKKCLSCWAIGIPLHFKLNKWFNISHSNILHMDYAYFSSWKNQTLLHRYIKQMNWIHCFVASRVYQHLKSYIRKIHLWDHSVWVFLDFSSLYYLHSEFSFCLICSCWEFAEGVCVFSWQTHEENQGPVVCDIFWPWEACTFWVCSFIIFLTTRLTGTSN